MDHSRAIDAKGKNRESGIVRTVHNCFAEKAVGRDNARMENARINGEMDKAAGPFKPTAQFKNDKDDETDASGKVQQKSKSD